jgi:hypothetical protein
MSQVARSWSRYCRSLAAQLGSSSKPESDSNASEDLPVEKKHRFGSQGRKEGLAQVVRCSVFMKEKNRYCSRPRVDGPTCLQHSGQHISIPSSAHTDEGDAANTANQEKESSAKCALCGTFVVSKKLLRHQKRFNSGEIIEPAGEIFNELVDAEHLLPSSTEVRTGAYGACGKPG